MKQRNPRSPGKTHGKKETFEYYKRFGKWFSKFWRKHWEIILAAIVGFIVGVFILPKVFR